MEQEDSNNSNQKILQKRKSHKKAPIEVLENAILLKVFSFLDAKSVVMTEMVCQKWKDVIQESIDEFPKMLMDQIKLHFDEGEVLVYPIDEKKVPSRHIMPPVEKLSGHMKHITINSLFIRGLIPIETTPVLRRSESYPFSEYDKRVVDEEILHRLASFLSTAYHYIRQPK
uniref:F-box domain-containing protein n=1 Tax=Acrobeloides nanus TaxID=290746 RepID=A0A914D2V8_9BILA